MKGENLKRILGSSFLSILFMFSMSSCLDEFLNLAPQTTRNTNDFYQTESDFNTAVAGTYAALKLSGLYSSSLIWIGEVSTDNTDYGKAYQTSLVYQFQFENLEYSSLNSIIYAAWRDHYIGIARANAILDRIDHVDIGGKKDQYKAEAQFLRALFYFNLVRIFGDVPLVLHEITSPYEANNLIRNSKVKVYEEIISDLQAAEKTLPPKYSTENAGRATQGAAKTLLAKVYLTLQQWENASDKLSEVISDKAIYGYKLLNNYVDVFDFNTPVNDEIIFNVQYKSGNIGQGSNFWESFAPDLVTTPVLGPNGGSGKGQNRPTEDMENAYEADDLRKNISMQNHYLLPNGRPVYVRYVTKYKQYGALPDESDVDWPVLRYSDVLLMYAEALNEQNDQGNALPYLNEVRERAGLLKKENLTQEELRTAIEQERRVEFAFENHRWFDLARTNRYVGVMQSKGFPATSRHNLFIIPQNEIDLNPEGITQNPDY